MIILYEMGERFAGAYNDSSYLKRDVDARLADVQGGDLINISDFWAKARKDTVNALPGYWRDTVQRFNPIPFTGARASHLIGQDSKAPQEFRDYHNRSKYIDGIIDFVSGGGSGFVVKSASRTRRLSGAETYYRAMSPDDYKVLNSTGRMPATTETSISPTRSFAENYNGVLVEFKVHKGTTDELVELGVRDQSKLVQKKYPEMTEGVEDWVKTSARFKAEKGQVNIGLGQGVGLDKFNDSILEYKKISTKK